MVVRLSVPLHIETEFHLLFRIDLSSNLDSIKRCPIYWTNIFFKDQFSRQDKQNVCVHESGTPTDVFRITSCHITLIGYFFAFNILCLWSLIFRFHWLSFFRLLLFLIFSFSSLSNVSLCNSKLRFFCGTAYQFSPQHNEISFSFLFRLLFISHRF